MYVKYKAFEEPAPGLGEALFKGTNLREPFPCAKGKGSLRFAVMSQAEKIIKIFPKNPLTDCRSAGIINYVVGA